MVETHKKKYGFVRVIYGFRTGYVRVRQTRGFTWNPRYTSQMYGFVRVKYGFRTGYVRVKSKPFLFSKKSTNVVKIAKCLYGLP